MPALTPRNSRADDNPERTEVFEHVRLEGDREAQWVAQRQREANEAADVHRLMLEQRHVPRARQGRHIVFILKLIWAFITSASAAILAAQINTDDSWRASQPASVRTISARGYDATLEALSVMTTEVALAGTRMARQVAPAPVPSLRAVSASLPESGCHVELLTGDAEEIHYVNVEAHYSILVEFRGIDCEGEHVWFKLSVFERDMTLMTVRTGFPEYSSDERQLTTIELVEGAAGAEIMQARLSIPHRAFPMFVGEMSYLYTQVRAWPAGLPEDRGAYMTYGDYFQRFE